MHRFRLVIVKLKPETGSAVALILLLCPLMHAWLSFVIQPFSFSLNLQIWSLLLLKFCSWFQNWCHQINHQILSCTFTAYQVELCFFVIVFLVISLKLWSKLCIYMQMNKWWSARIHSWLQVGVEIRSVYTFKTCQSWFMKEQGLNLLKGMYFWLYVYTQLKS